MAWNPVKSLKKALKGGGIAHNVETILTGGAATGLNIVDQYQKEDKQKKADVLASEAAAAQKAGVAKQQSDLATRRRLRLRTGQRSTRVSGTTPDLFASSAGQTRTLLG